MRFSWTLEKQSWGIKSFFVLSPANQRRICTKVLHHYNILEYFADHSVSQGNITKMSTHQLPQGGNCRIPQNCIVFKHFLLYPISQILSTDLLFLCYIMWESNLEASLEKEASKLSYKRKGLSASPYQSLSRLPTERTWSTMSTKPLIWLPKSRILSKFHHSWNLPKSRILSLFQHFWTLSNSQIISKLHLLYYLNFVNSS